MRHLVPMLALGVWLASASAAVAETPFLFPLDCSHTDGCYVLSMPDVSAVSDSPQDGFCGPQARDGGKELDIGLSSISAIKDNVPVVAARGGEVISVTTNAPDQVRGEGVPLPVGVTPCGNGVILDHDGGWNTVYCHLQQGSIPLKAGQKVKAGQTIGYIGLSGATRWPKLSFSAIRNGSVFDPMTRANILRGCIPGKTASTLFSDYPKYTYRPAAIAGTGVTVEAIDDNDVRRGYLGTETRIHHANPNITLWTLVLGTRQGDTLHITVYPPASSLAYTEKHIPLREDKDALPVLLDIKAKDGFKKGSWRAQVKIERRVGTRDYATETAFAFTVL